MLMSVKRLQFSGVMSGTMLMLAVPVQDILAVAGALQTHACSQDTHIGLTSKCVYS
jgi:hypothetical protein